MLEELLVFCSFIRINFIGIRSVQNIDFFFYFKCKWTQARWLVQRVSWCVRRSSATSLSLSLSLFLSPDHRTFSLALRGNSLSDISWSRTAAWNYGKDRWTGRSWTLLSDMRAREKALLVFALSLLHSYNGHCPAAARNNGMDEWYGDKITVYVFING